MIPFISTRGGQATPQRLDLMDKSIADAIDIVKRLFLRGGPWNEVRWRPTTTAAQHSLLPWELLYIDPRESAALLKLPVHTDCLGCEIRIKNTTSSVNTITLHSLAEGVGPHTFVDGASSVVMTSPYAALHLRAAFDGWWAI